MEGQGDHPGRIKPVVKFAKFAQAPRGGEILGYLEGDSGDEENDDDDEDDDRKKRRATHD
jgi:hypothetical protein